MSVQGELRSIDAIVTPQEDTRIEPEILPVEVRIVHYLFLNLFKLNNYTCDDSDSVRSFQF